MIECKNYSKPVSAEKVDAFVTKSKDAGAHHAVLASSTTFQSGAIEVAKKHHIALLSVTQSDTSNINDFGASFAGTTPAHHISRVKLRYADGRELRLSEESHLLTYYVKNIRIRSANEMSTLERSIRPFIENWRGVLGQKERITVPLPSGSFIFSPDDGEVPLDEVAEIEFEIAMVEARVISGKASIDPYLLLPDIAIRDVTGSETFLFKGSDLLLGIGTSFKAGTFYENPNLSMYYYCEEASDDRIRLHLIESFQHGRLIQATITISADQAEQYIAVSDRKTLTRLERRLARFKALQK